MALIGRLSPPWAGQWLAVDGIAIALPRFERSAAA
jgi:hypothetical protein